LKAVFGQLHWILQTLGDSSKETLLLSAIDIAAAFAVMFIIGIPALDAFGFILLIEACALMLIGSALEFTTTPSRQLLYKLVGKGGEIGSKEEAMKIGRRAAFYTITGFMLFFESALLALLFFI
jgi:hypothetical protein